MEDNDNLIESLLERASDYGKTTYKLLKLRALDNVSEVISTLIPHSIVLFFFVIFMFFLNLGLAFWLGEIIGKTFYGFLAVAAFYGVLILVIHLFLRKWLKRVISGYIIKNVLK